MSAPPTHSPESGNLTLRRVSNRWNDTVRDPAARWWMKLGIPGRVLVVVVAFVALAVLVPSAPVGRLMAPGEWTTILFAPIGVYILLAIGLNVVVGQAGMLDLGYVAFYAVGGYAMGLLGSRQHWDFWWVVPVAVVLAAGSGLVLGAPTLRLRGDYLAIVTLGFGQIISTSANNWSWTGGPQGVLGIPHPPKLDLGFHTFDFSLTSSKAYFDLALLAIFVVVFCARRLEHSRVGRGWAAIREDEDAAELMGVPTYRFRLWAFAIGAAIGGLGGVLFASQISYIDPTIFSYQVSILIVASVVLGGSGNLPGVILGAFLVAWLPERFRGFEKYRILVFGAMLVVMMIFRPEGLLPSRQRRAEMADVGGGGMNAALLPPTVEGDA
jgi:branched-chain amino acid transport system permease protein